MSALGHQRTFRRIQLMSAYPRTLLSVMPSPLRAMMCSKHGRQHTMANDLFVHHAVSGGAERSGPFKTLNEAIQKACALLRTHGPTAIVSIHDNGHVIMGGNEVRKRCEAEQ